MSSIFNDVSLTLLILSGVSIVVDYVFGVIKAVNNNNLKSREMFYGLLRKSTYVAAVILAIIADMLLGVVTRTGESRTAIIGVCVYIIVTELLSIYENMKAISPSVWTQNNPIETIKEQLNDISSTK